jgi:F-type H+-transporting ATPase subunit b
MLLEINPLVLPDVGLVFWNTIAFLVLLIVLGKFAWKPMLKAINERESGIEEALLKADKMKAEITAMQNENEALLAKAREERATIIKEAKEASEKMVNEAKDKAKSEYERIISDAQAAIAQQKNAAMVDVKNQVGALVINVAEKVLRKELSNKADQESYIKQIAEEVKLKRDSCLTHV